MQRPQSQSHTAVTVPKPRCMHALPGGTCSIMSCWSSVDEEPASHGFGIIGLDHCRQLLPCLSNQACTVHLQASMELSPSVAAQTHHSSIQAHLPMIGCRQCVYNVTLAESPLPYHYCTGHMRSPCGGLALAGLMMMTISVITRDTGRFALSHSCEYRHM
jgi:hypothetical protein